MVSFNLIELEIVEICQYKVYLLPINWKVSNKNNNNNPLKIGETKVELKCIYIYIYI